MAEKTAQKPKLKLKNYNFELEDKDLALILAIQDLTGQIRRLANK